MVGLLNFINPLFPRNFKIGDKFIENDVLVCQVIDIRSDKYGKQIIYKMIDDNSLKFFGTYLKNEFSFYFGSKHYKTAILKKL